MPGDIFYENSTKGQDSFRIGFGRVSDDDIKRGIKIIGDNIMHLSKPPYL